MFVLSDTMKAVLVTSMMGVTGSTGAVLDSNGDGFK